MQENAKKKRVKILEKVVITGIADKGKAVGRGYLELTGYVGRLRL